MREVLHPELYHTPDRSRYLLDIQPLLDSLELVLDTLRGEGIFDNDEYGEIFMGTLFHEWDFAGYLSIAEGLVTDRIVVWGDSGANNLRLLWYTLWQDNAEAQEFFQNYKSLVAKKRSLSLVDSNEVVDFKGDTTVYMEQRDNIVLAMENVPDSLQSRYLAAVDNFALSDWNPVVAKRSSILAKATPRIDKRLKGKRVYRRYLTR